MAALGQRSIDVPDNQIARRVILNRIILAHSIVA